MKRVIRSGFSIIQAVIAMVIMGVIVYALSDFLISANKSQKSIQNSIDFDLTVARLSLLLNSKACNGAFKSNTGLIRLFTATPPAGFSELLAAPVAIEKIMQGAGTLLDMTNPALGGGLTLNRLEVTSAVRDGVETITEGSPAITKNLERYLITIGIGATRPEGTPGFKVLQKDFSVKVLVDPLDAYKVTHCSSSVASSSNFVLGSSGVVNGGAEEEIDISSSSLVMITGSYDSSDAGPMSGMFAKRSDGTWVGNLHVATGCKVGGALSTTNICQPCGGITYCAKIEGTKLKVSTSGNVSYSYVTF